MGNAQLGVPEDLALHLRDRLGLKVFVETGTYKGGTSTWAAQHFEQVYTIEGYEPRYRKVTATYAGQFPNLTFIFGDSRTELWRVIRTLTTPPLLWLDSHWCGEGAHDCNGDECPLMEEITAINEHYLAAEFVILIDDARLFLNPPPYPHDPAQWPTYPEVLEKLNEYPRMVTVKDDVIIAVPLHYESVLHEFYGGR